MELMAVDCSLNGEMPQAHLLCPHVADKLNNSTVVFTARL